ncbi:hypothetical protein C3941_00865 [Kaistia algarum]|uniref:AsmA family protein n=1 Tax=Kaistia algarum TaxID=2083279 RepID=UPI000CE8724B|nr:AsmA-like C-terminal region-containing protein [Kaistia algarum]MCX5513232.1 AsmA family protein [Kaistia algarum]PPE81305.1 hypothetical protein C3941_00865 [Kaistia algarum]
MKRLASLSIALVVLVGAFIITAPSLVSIEVVRRSLAYEIAGWGGSALTFEGTPTVAFRPYLTVTFPKARIASSRNGETLVSMDQLSAQVPLLPLLFQGRIEPSAFDFRKPEFHFESDAAGRPNWTLPYGLDSTSRVSRLTVTGGSIHYRAADGRVVDIGDVDAVLRWPSVAGAASFEGSASWRGQSGDFSASIGSLRDFFGGQPTALQFALASTPLRTTFNGQVQSVDGLTANGEISAETPSIRQLGDIFGWKLSEHTAYGAASLRTSLSFARGVATMADAALSIDGSDGEGALALDLTGPRPSLQATLAFDDFEAAPLVELASSFVRDVRATPDAPIDPAPMRWVDFDMRLSTERLLYSGSNIGRVAGSAALRDGRLDIALADMRLFDGRLSGNVTADASGPRPSAALRLRLDSLPLKSLPNDWLPLLSARGTAEGTLNLEAAGNHWSEFSASLSGDGDLVITDGGLDGVDLTALRNGWGSADTTARAAISGSTRFSTASCAVTIRGDVARVDQAEATGSDFKVSLAGAAALADSGYDLRGEIRFGTATGSAAEPVPFTVHGDGKGAPIFAPDPAPMRRSEQGSAGDVAPVRLTDRIVPAEFFAR